jgi:hypothetical protein
MSYLNQTDIETYTGFGSTDFKQAGSTMSATQWATFCTSVVNRVTQLINRFCNVSTLETHTATEYHSGRNDGQQDFRNYFYYGGSNPNSQYYTELDRTFYLREVCYSTTATVEEDLTVSSTFGWVTRTQRTSTATGDYNIFSHNDLTSIQFINNVPMWGRDNLRITYIAGYASGSAELDAINLIAIQIAQRILLIKKKVQEAATIRGSGVRDYSPMFELTTETNILTNDVKEQLLPYKRHLMLDDVYSAQ